jgi:aquaporin Z
MGATAVAIVLSPWGQRSGAHFNPAVTLTYWGLGKIDSADAAFYVAAQFAGATAGVSAAWLILGSALASPTVNFVATLPGPAGRLAAFAAEAAISFALMLAILVVSNDRRVSRYTPAVAGTLVALYITFEAPISGMSMNPARSFGPAFVAAGWRDLWIYLVAPPLGMLAAAAIYVRVGGLGRIACAKLHHHNSRRCIFRCAFDARLSGASVTAPAPAARLSPDRRVMRSQ